MNGILTVSQLNQQIKEYLGINPFFSNVWVRGEIANFRHHSSGHMYFTLKDEESSLRAVMFRSRTLYLEFTPYNGLAVIARGEVSVYPRDGVYQLYVAEMFPDGIGSLYLGLQQLKAKLEAEGLFAQDRKKPLPFLPKKIGIVTSLQGAAVRDMIAVLSRRFPGLKLLIVPVTVQGERAAGEIVEALELLNRLRLVDVIIVGRGGGSQENLWAFNQEEVVRAVAASQIPVISAVGHETDYTLTDLAADRRAPTPSAAAELAVPEKESLLLRVAELNTRTRRALQRWVENFRLRLERLEKSRYLQNPKEIVSTRREKLQLLTQRLQHLVERHLVDKDQALALLAEKLDALSPLKVLQRGYALAEKEDGTLVKAAEGLEPGERIRVRFAKGMVLSRVERVVKGGVADEKGRENGC